MFSTACAGRSRGRGRRGREARVALAGIRLVCRLTRQRSRPSSPSGRRPRPNGEKSPPGRDPLPLRAAGTQPGWRRVAPSGRTALQAAGRGRPGSLRIHQRPVDSTSAPGCSTSERSLSCRPGPDFSRPQDRESGRTRRLTSTHVKPAAVRGAMGQAQTRGLTDPGGSPPLARGIRLGRTRAGPGSRRRLRLATARSRLERQPGRPIASAPSAATHSHVAPTESSQTAALSQTSVST